MGCGSARTSSAWSFGWVAGVGDLDGAGERRRGLDLIDDTLDTMGVPYDVLDSSTTDLTEAFLATGDHGHYNGIIVTNSELFLSGGGSGFTASEWGILHAYERDFRVNEAVISGFPAANIAGGIDYGMGQVFGGSGISGQWTGEAGASVFDYINTANTLDVTDFSFAGHPPQPTAAAPRSPLCWSMALIPTGTSSRTRVTTMAARCCCRPSAMHGSWCTRRCWPTSSSTTQPMDSLSGVAKSIYQPHIDDLFLPADIWDPGQQRHRWQYPIRQRGRRHHPFQRVTSELCREPPNGLTTSISSSRSTEKASVMNASGSAITVPVAQDTYIREDQPTNAFGTANRLRTRASAGFQSMSLIQFDLSSVATGDIASATIRLPNATVNGSRTTSDAELCIITEPWVDSEATWQQASDGVAWSSGGGVVYNPNECFEFVIDDNADEEADLTSIVEDWIFEEPNYGVAIISTQYSAQMSSSEGVATPELDVVLVGDPGLDGAFELTQAVIAQRDEFWFLNHTFTHADMDASAGMTAALASEEITLNRQIWNTLGLPFATENLPVLVTGNHSGLADDAGTELDISDDTPYPAGTNPELLAAYASTGIGYTASDASQPNQGSEEYIAGTNVLLLPRYPTAVFYNVRTPAELEDEYNYIFYERYVEMSIDPCTVPAAICSPRSYAEILEAEADLGLRHMLTYRQWPHFFHMANLVDYDGNGSSLLFDWLDAVADKYESYFVLPVQNLPYHEIAADTTDRVARQSVTVTGTLDLTTGVVMLSSSAPATVDVTGLAGGASYGGQLQSTLQLNSTPQQYVADAFEGPGGGTPLLAPLVGDTRINETQPTNNFGSSTFMTMRTRAGRQIQGLMQFDLDGLATGTVTSAVMTFPDLFVNGTATSSDAELCRATQAWEENVATWDIATTGMPWINGAGAEYDPASCVGFAVDDGIQEEVDVTAIVADWHSGAAPNYGFVLRTNGTRVVRVSSSETALAPSMLVLVQ